MNKVLLSLANVVEKSQSDRLTERVYLRLEAVHYKASLLKESYAILLDSNTLNTQQNLILLSAMQRALCVLLVIISLVTKSKLQKKYY